MRASFAEGGTGTPAISRAEAQMEPRKENRHVSRISSEEGPTRTALPQGWLRSHPRAGRAPLYRPVVSAFGGGVQPRQAAVLSPSGELSRHGRAGHCRRALPCRRTRTVRDRAALRERRAGGIARAEHAAAVLEGL